MRAARAPRKESGARPAGVAILVLAALLAVPAALLGACAEEEPQRDSSEAAADAGGGARAELIAGLRRGGHVLVFRHAITDAAGVGIRERLGDCARQRNLVEAGREQARRIGEDLRRLGIPLSDVRASPMCRTRETAELIAGRVRVDRRLVTTGLVGTEQDDRRRARILRRMAATPPPGGGNTLLVTHSGNLGAAFEESLLEGEALVFRPRPGEPPEPLGRLSEEDLAQAGG